MKHLKAKEHKPTVKKAQPDSPSTTPKTGSRKQGGDHIPAFRGGSYFSNSPVFGMNGPVQSKVTVGKANDPYEKEADQVADRVSAGLTAPQISTLPAGGLNNPAQRQEEEEEEKVQTMAVQRQEEEEEEEPVQTMAVQRQEEEEEEEPVQTMAVQRQEEEEEEEPVQTMAVQRQEEEEEEEPVQTMAIQRQEEEEEEEPVQTSSEGASARPSMSNVAAGAINNKGPGSPLSPSVRSRLESGMGTDLSDVRVHDDSRSREAAHALNARAFTHKNDIWLGRGASADDVDLMAHEATHVVQQQSAVQRKVVQRDSKTPAAANANAGTDPASGAEGRYSGPKGTVDKTKSPVEMRLAQLKLPDIKLPFGVSSPLPPKTDEERPSDQITKWRQEAKSGSGIDNKLDDKLTAEHSPRTTKSGQPIYFLKLKGADNYVIGNTTTIKNSVSRPFWNKGGSRVFYDVDHQRELQLGGQHDAKSNMWLLESEANRSSGRNIKNERDKVVGELIDAADKDGLWTQKPSVEQARRNYNIYADSLTGGLAISGSPGETWTIDQIRDQGAPLDGLKALTKKEIEKAGLEGSAEQLVIYTNESGGGMRRIPWGEGPTTRPVDMPFGQNFQVNSVTYDDGTGSISGTAFGKGGKGGSTGMVNEAPLSFDIVALDAVDYGGYISAASVTRAAQSAIKKLNGLSELQISEAELTPDKGITARGQVLPSISLFEKLGIEIVIDGNNVFLSKTFNTGDFSFPGPVKVTDSSLELFAGTQGLGVNGQVFFEVEKVGKGKIGGSGSTGGGFAIAGEFEFDTELFDQAKITVEYKNNTFSGKGELKIGPEKIKGINSASIQVAVNGEAWEATGTVEPNVPGVKEASLTAKYDPEKGFEIGGKLIVGAEVPGIKGGTLTATVSQKEGGNGYALKASGDIPLDIPGVDASISGEYDDGAFTAKGTVEYKKGMVSGSITAGVTNRAVDEKGNITGDPTDKLTAFGGGSLTIKIAPWLQGTVGVKLLPNGEIEVSGEIALPDTLEVFPEKKMDKNLFTIGMDIPIVGVAVAGQRIGIFANISGGLDLSAGFGPGKLENVRLAITYNPAHEENTTVTGSASFVIPAHAGLRLFVRGSLGVGIPIVSASAGLEIGGQLGLEGEARADAEVNWSPATKLALDAKGSITVQPVFKFDITGFVLVEADLLLTTVELYSKRWELASLEYGSDLKFGVTFPIKYREGEPFDITLDDVEFTTPDIDPGELLSGLIGSIA